MPDIWDSDHVRHCPARESWAWYLRPPESCPSIPYVLFKCRDATRGARVACWDFPARCKSFWTKTSLSGGCQAVLENGARYQKTLSVRFLVVVVRSGPAMFRRMLQISPSCKLSGTAPVKFVRHRCPALPARVAPIFRSRTKSVSGYSETSEGVPQLRNQFFKNHQVAPEIQAFEDACRNHCFGSKTSNYTYWNDL